MAPKKKSRAEDSGKAPSSAKQRREELAAAHEKERLDEIAQDELVVRHSEKQPALSVSDLFSSVIQLKDFPLRKPEFGRAPFDWSVLKAKLAERTAASPTWFMQFRVEDLLLDPTGLDGEKVECAVIAETSEPTLAPMHMVVRELRPYSDPEDNTPERVLSLKDQGLCWREVRGDSGDVINVFVLQKRGFQPTVARSFSFAAAAPAAAASAPAVAAAAPTAAAAPSVQPAAPASGGGFGSSSATAATAASALASAAQTVKAAPTAFGAAAAGSPPPAAQPSFGFGPSSSGSLSKAPSFGFGAPAAAPAAAAAAPPANANAAFNGRPISPKPAQIPQVGFGFGAAKPPAPAAGNGAPVGAAGGFGASAAAPVGANAGSAAAPAAPSVDSVHFTLWTDKRLKEMKKEIRAGSRIVVEDVQLPAPVSRTCKVQLQNDVKDSVDVAVEAIIRKEFARRDGELKKIDKWLDDCPVYEEKLAAALQTFRERSLSARVEEGSDAYEAVASALRPFLTGLLTPLVQARRKMLDEEAAQIEGIEQLLKKRLIAPKSAFRVLKYYPSNERLKFRAYSKVTGIHEAGEHADECVPPAYQQSTAANFAAAVAARKASIGA